MRWKQAEKETLERRREGVRRGRKVMRSTNVDAVVTTCDGSGCGWDMGKLLQKLGAVKLCVGAGRFDDKRLLVEVEHLMCSIK
jgi:predicted phosphoribosyltransferase